MGYKNMFQRVKNNLKIDFRALTSTSASTNVVFNKNFKPKSYRKLINTSFLHIIFHRKVCLPLKTRKDEKKNKQKYRFSGPNFSRYGFQREHFCY